MEPIVEETKIEEDISLENVSLDDKPSENNKDLVDTTTETKSNEESDKDHQSLVQKNTNPVNFCIKIEGPDDDNQFILAELEKIKEQRQHLKEECLGLKGEMKELESERDKLAGLLKLMKVEWEKEYKKLQVKYQEVENNKSFLESQVNELQHEKARDQMELIELKSHLSELKHEHVKTQSELHELRSSQEAETEKLQAVENQKAALSKIFQDQENGLQMMMKGMAAERESWQQREADLLERQLVIEETLKKKECENDVLRKELESVLADKRAIKQRLLDAGKEKLIADGKIRELESVKTRSVYELTKSKNDEEKFSSQIDASKKHIEQQKAQIVTLTKKLAESETEKRKIIQMLEKKIEATERTNDCLMNDLELMKQDKESRMRKKFHEKEKNIRKKYHGHSRDSSFDIDKIDLLEQRITELENSLKSSNIECDQLRETLAEVQSKYLHAVSDKDQLMLTKRELDKKVKSLDDQLQD
ncbi:14595_t:CDS:1, partial [Gigaspora margarita]